MYVSKIPCHNRKKIIGRWPFYICIYKMKLTKLLGLNAIYSETVGSSGRLLGPSMSIVGSFNVFFLMEIYNGGPNIYVCLYIYIYT